MKTSVLRWFLLLAAVLVPAAIDPLADTAGPLPVRIQGPRKVPRTGAPLPVTIMIENSSAAPVAGTVQLRVIDRWRGYPTATRAPFSHEDNDALY